MIWNISKLLIYETARYMSNVITLVNSIEKLTFIIAYFFKNLSSLPANEDTVTTIANEHKIIINFILVTEIRENFINEYWDLRAKGFIRFYYFRVMVNSSSLKTSLVTNENVMISLILMLNLVIIFVRFIFKHVTVVTLKKSLRYITTFLNFYNELNLIQNSYISTSPSFSHIC